MKALCFFMTLVAAKLIVCARWGVPVSLSTPAVLLWQDALAALAFALAERTILRRRAAWFLYATLVLYVAINVPVAMVLASPLTPALLRAAGGPLRDSIVYYASAANLAAFATVAGIGTLLPFVLKPPGSRTGSWMAASGMAIAAAGVLTAGDVDTRGLQRNAFGALLPEPIAWTPAAVPVDVANVRNSPFSPAQSSSALLRYRGAAAGRNVVMIVLESTGASYLKTYGAAEDPMPRLTQLASSSIVFENAYSVYPESIKGLFATLCSRYPPIHTPAEEVAALPCPALPEVFRKAGYRTALFHSGRFAYLGMQDVVAGRGFEVLEDAAVIGGNVDSSFGTDERSTVERMLSWIDNRDAGQPFFLTYLPIAGHHPYSVPEVGPFAGDLEIDNYRNALHYADSALGRLLDGLRKRGLERETLFLVFGDHGEAFGQHSANSGHTLFIFDENVHVPFVIAAPGLLATGVRDRRVMSLVDTSPTVLDLMGLAGPAGIEGRSMLDPASTMALFFTDYSLPLVGLRDGCWKFIHDVGASRSALFDVCTDRGETENLARGEALRSTVYTERLMAWIAATGTQNAP
jgi:hypothetical protein